jgi:hypothetical protein
MTRTINPNILNTIPFLSPLVGAPILSVFLPLLSTTSRPFHFISSLLSIGGRTETVGWALNHYQNPWTGHGKYFARRSLIGRHRERVESIALPSARVQRALLSDQQLFSSRQYYAITASRDQTVRLFRWGVNEGAQPTFIHPLLLSNPELVSPPFLLLLNVTFHSLGLIHPLGEIETRA